MFIKKIISAALAVLLSAMAVAPAFAETPQKDNPPVQISCKSAILMEISTGEVLFEYNPDQRLAPASITKVMTMLLVMEALENGNIALGDRVTASEYACSMGGSQIWLEPGENMTVDEMLKATAVGSANDAAVALAEHIGGSESIFVQAMNQKAADLGLQNTNFVNACGLDEEGHYTSASDIAVMCRALLKYPEISAYTSTWMDSLRGGETELVNTNKLVRFYPGCNGLKTGTTDAAGHCLAASAAKGDLGLISIVLGSKTSGERFDSAKALLDYGFATFVAVPAPDISKQITPVRVKNGDAQWAQAVAKPPRVILVEKSDKNSIEQTVVMNETVQAPVKAGQRLGRVAVTVGGAPKCEYDIVATKDIAKLSFFGAFMKLLGKTAAN